MGYILLVVPLILIVLIISSIISIHKRIDQLEERIAAGYSPILGDIHRRLEVLEQERRN